MNAGPVPAGDPPAEARSELERLELQVEAMRAVLVRLLQDVVQAENRLAHSDPATLVEVNEQLVVAALTSQAEAQSAAEALRTVPPAPEAVDALTGLPNRTAFRQRCTQAMAHARRQGARLALLFLDLDRFKPLNDNHGHAFGDKLLCLVADRMRVAVREVDTVSRHGGDEFVVLLADLATPQDAQAVAEKLVAAIGAPAEIEGRVVDVSASVGIAIFPDDGDSVDSLVRAADAAMYRSKRRGTGGIAFHDRGAESAPDPRDPIGEAGAAAAEPERRQALLREANERLVLAALTAQELRAAAEQARQRQDAFMAAVADELRNPLAPIRIAAAMLGNGAAELPLLPRVRGIVEQHLNDMARLVGTLVDAERVDDEGLAPERGPVAMGPLLATCIAGHRPTMERRHQRFEFDCPAPLPTVQGDAQRLGQVIGNLLDNASKHTPDGGTITVAAAVSAQALTITVADNGIGIRPQMLSRVFDPFVQDIHAIGINGVGLGIGLTIVRALVRAHGGELVAHSAGLGRGSQFVVTLPLAAAGAAPAASGTDAAN